MHSHMQGQDGLGSGVPEYFLGNYGCYPAPSSWDDSDDNSCIDPQLRSLQHEYPYPSLETFHAHSQTYAGRYFTAYDPAAHGFDKNHNNAYDGHLYHYSFPGLLPGIIDEYRHTRHLSPSGNTPSSTGSSSGDFGISPDALRFPQELSLTFESPVSAHSPPGGMPTTPHNLWTPHYPVIINPTVAATPGGNLALSMRDLQVTPDPEGEESFVNDRDPIHTKIQLPQELELSEQLASPPASSIFDEDDEMTMHQDSGELESDNDSEFIPGSSHAPRRGPAGLRHSLRSPRQQKPKAINDPNARIHKTTIQDHPPAIGKSRLKSKKISPNKRSQKPKAFPCSFHHYGCPAVFCSKNEWKRHVSSQHVQLGFYRCDLGSCSSEFAGHQHRGYNDFNRKDLFTQHCRRMHAPWAMTDKNMDKVSKKEKDNFDKELEQIRARCWVDARKPPERTRCGFCDAKFIEGQVQNGVNLRAWDQRMEHMGTHYERDRFNAKDERADKGLQEWALREGVIRQAKTTNRYWLVGLEPVQDESSVVTTGWRRSGRVMRRKGSEDEEDDDVEEEQHEKEESESSEEDGEMELGTDDDDDEEEEEEEEQESRLKAPDAEADDESEDE